MNVEIESFKFKLKKPFCEKTDVPNTMEAETKKKIQKGSQSLSIFVVLSTFTKKPKKNTHTHTRK